MSDENFEHLVESAVANLPVEFTELLDNVAIMVEDAPPADNPHLFGYYHGVPLTERDSSYAGALPDRIVIFRQPFLTWCDSVEEVASEVTITVAHEVAHYFGISDAALHRWGYG